jgi:serine/threonine-protein kinase
MKYIAGTSLEDVLEQHKQTLTADYIQRVLWEAACALGHAHQRGIVHRDVKPANIMFDHDGRVMLTDFGISKALQAASGFTGTGMIIGTPHYMAPEQAKGQQVDGRADQYSMGVVGYRMITGQLPFGGDSVHTILYKHIFEPAPRTSSIRTDMPPHLSEAISRALAKEVDQRYATMEEFATAVWPEQPVSVPTKGGKGAATQRRPPPRAKGPVTADTPTEVTSAPTTPIPQSGMKVGGGGPKKSRTGLFVGVAVVAVAGVGGYLALGQKSSAPPPAVSSPTQTNPAAVETVRVTAPPSPVTQTPRRQTPSRQITTPAQTAATGFITVNSDPPGTVFIDSREVGSTPVVEFTVSTGRHTIRVERPGFKTKSETVDVGANATVRKRWVLEPEGSD